MMADAISHTVLLGIVIAFIITKGAKWYAYASWRYFCRTLNSYFSSMA